MNNDDWERLKNFTTSNFWGTDKEFKETAPHLGGLIIVALIIIGLVWLFSK